MLARDAKGAAERASYLPATLATDDAGRLVAEPLKWGGSSDFVAFARATALVVVPEGVERGRGRERGRRRPSAGMKTYGQAVAR